jgi:transposase InsO family protein
VLSWIQHAVDAAEIEDIPAHKRVAVASTKLTGTAAMWFSGQRHRWGAGWPSWEEFTTALVSWFLPRTRAWDARDELDTLRLGNGHPNRYHARFLLLVAECGDMSADDQLAYFRRGLPQYLRAVFNNQLPRTVPEAMDLVHIHYVEEVDKKGKESNSSSSNSRVSRQQTNAVPMETAPKKARDLSKIKCHTCHVYGHVAVNCPKDTTREDATIKRTVGCVLLADEAQLLVGGRVNHREVRFVVDTGAGVTCLSRDLCKALQLPQIARRLLKMPLGTRTAPLKGPVTIAVQNRAFSLPIVELDSIIPGVDGLLGMDWMSAVGVVNVDCTSGNLAFRDDAKNQKEEEDEQRRCSVFNLSLIDSVGVDDEEEGGDGFFWEVEPVPRVFDWSTLLDSGKLTVGQLDCLKRLLKDNASAFAWSARDVHKAKLEPMQIRIETGVNPISIYPARYNESRRDIIRKEVSAMLETGVIQRSTSPWSAPVVLIMKKNGTHRLCINFRDLNKVTQPDPFPMPRIASIMDRFHGSRYYSTIDLKSGFWQLPMHPDSVRYTGFSTPDGHFEFLKMPFGLTTAPAEFTKRMASIFSGRDNIDIYVDDIVVFTPSFEKHAEKLQEVFGLLQTHGLVANVAKCRLCRTELNVLGTVVSEKGRKIDQSRIDAILQYPSPKDKPALQRFLGLVAFVQDFIPNCSDIARPLYDLLKKDSSYVWKTREKEAFEGLRASLTSSPVLVHPDFSKRWIVYADASDIALGAVLCQEDDSKREHPVAYLSRSLKTAERKYHIREKECLAIVWALRSWSHYLEGNTVLVRNDHQSLSYLRDYSNPTGRLARWQLTLGQYNVKVEYRKGSTQSHVDALSRVLFVREYVDPTEDVILFKFLRGKKPENLSDQEIKKYRNWMKMFRLNATTLEVLKGGEWKIMPKVKDRPMVIERAHEVGHFQVESTMNRLTLRYYWKGMQNEVKAWISRCKICARNEPGRTGDHPMVILDRPKTIFDRVHIDLITGLPTAKDGSQHICVLMDAMSKFPIAFAIPDKSARTVAKCLWMFMTTFGFPKALYSDQGTEFVNQVVQELLHVGGTEQLLTSAYHPRSNGLVERFNKTLITALRKVVEAEPDRWPDYLPMILYAYRTNVHFSTGFTPYELVFGKRAVVLDSMDLKTLCDGNDHEADARGDLEKDLQGRVDAVVDLKAKRTSAELANRAASEKQKRNADKDRDTGIVYAKGDTVMMKVPQSGKLKSPFAGPYVVKKVDKNQGRVWLATAGGNAYAKNPVHMSRLKIVGSVDQSEFEIERIVDDKIVQGRRYFRVNWKGFSSDGDTWEPVESFNSTKTIEDYLNEHASDLGACNR